MKYLVLPLLLLAGQTYAVTWNSNGSVTSIQSIHDTQAANGDVITLPASATFKWTTKLTLTKGITLQGQTGTIVQDAVLKGPLIDWTLPPGKVARLSGIQWQNGGRAASEGALFKIIGSNTDGSRFRFDHCTWNKLNGQVRTDGVLGVFDHLDVTIQHTPWCYPWQSKWNGAPYADRSWSDPITWNSDQFLFIEDCTFHGPSTAGSFIGGIVDMYNGSRCVIRHNKLYDATIQTHGTETGGGRSRGHVALAAYKNDFIATSPHSGAIALLRSGVSVFHDNQTTGWADTSIALACYRTWNDLSPFLGADGENKFDNNQSGAPFYSGTASAPSTTNTSGAVAVMRVTVSGNPGWPADKWKGYSIVKTGGFVTGEQTYSVISGSGANYIEYARAAFKTPLGFAIGNPFIVTHVNHALDQPGVHGGAVVTGLQPVCPWPAGQNDQLIDPCYAWQNTRTENAQQINMGSGDNATIRLGVHYINGTAKPGYADYAYPHPLTAGGTTSTIAPPTNLHTVP